AATVIDPRDASAPAGRSGLLPYLARLVLAPSLEVYAEDPVEGAPVDRAAIAARLVHRGERVADEAGLVVLPSQSWMDLEATVSLGDDRLALRARLANALD